MQHKALGITLLGHGIVGSGVARILTEQRAMLERRTGLTFDIHHVVVRDVQRHQKQGVKLPWTQDALAAISDPRTQIVVELMGGIDAAGECVRAALKLGKPVVTANKSLLAAHGRELFALARKHNTVIAFEASCGGGIPIIGALLIGLVGNRISDLVGIVNGTCNFILTKMTQNGWTYEDALAEAQRAGFAEADPAMDISGRDAAQKLAILAGLAFDAQVLESDIHVEGINRLNAIDIRFAGELGYVIKLLAIASRQRAEDSSTDAEDDGSITARVHPTLVHKSDMLADVSGSFNAISVYGHALGHALFYGRGAGQMPTASAVVSDLVAVGMGTAAQSFAQSGQLADRVDRATILKFDELRSRYYLRLTARDEPGVMAQVTAALGKQGISLSAVLQHEMDASHFVPVVIITHKAREGAIQQALREIDALSIVQPPTVCLRIVDSPKEFRE